MVEYNEKKTFEVKLKEMKSELTTQIAEETDISQVIETVKQRVNDAKLPDIEVVRILWDVLMDAVQWSGKNQQQNANAALRQVCTFKEVFIPDGLVIMVVLHLISKSKETSIIKQFWAKPNEKALLFVLSTKLSCSLKQLLLL